MPTHYPNGVTNAAANSTLFEFGAPDPTKYHVWFDDFDNFEADQWVITTTEAGVGAATEAIQNERGGVLKLTNDDADDDNDFLQWSGDDATGAIETFKFTAGKPAWMKARLKVSDATQSDFVIGLQLTDTTPLNVTDGVFFQKDDGDANLDFHVEKDDTASSATAIATLADDTYFTVGFWYDGASRVYYYYNDSQKGYLATTNLPNDEELTVSFGIQNGAAAAKSMSIDYIMVAETR